MNDFSELLGAAKASDRTELYKLLVALFCLGGERTGVSTRQITSVLKLHLGSRMPANVSAGLRQYSAHIKPVAKGPPLTWGITRKGIQHLETVSGRSLSTVPGKLEYDWDVGVVCALEHPEFDAVIHALGGPAAWNEVDSPQYSHLYRSTTLTTNGGRTLRVVGTTASSMGLTAAAIVTTQLVTRFRPRIVVMIGIAAGTRDGNKQFGDVLVADPSVDYNSGKVVDIGGVRDFLPDPYPLGLNPRLRSVLQRYRGRQHEIFQMIRGRWSGGVPTEGNRLHLGPLGAADQVIDDARRIHEIQRNWRKLIGVEMETYGVYRACHEAPEPRPRYASFKAVCDFAAEKSDSWQSYAAYVAAEFGFEFLRREWPALWPAELEGK